MQRRSKGHQLFAQRVDEQLQVLLISAIERALNNVDEGLAERYRPEMEAVVGISYYVLSFMSGRPTPGMQVFRLALLSNQRDFVPTVHAEHSSSLLAICTLLGMYIFRRLQRTALVRGWQDFPPGSMQHVAWKRLQLLDVIGKCFGMSNTIAFLISGVYPSIVHRIAGYQMVAMQMQPQQKIDIAAESSSSTAVSPTLAPGYSETQLYVKSRQVMWTTLTSVLAAAAIAADWQEVQTSFRRLSNRIVRTITTSRVGTFVQRFVAARRGTANTAAITSSNRTASAFDCVACRNPAEAPHTPECGHIYCYVCLSLALASLRSSSSSSTSTFSSALVPLCPACDAKITVCLRWEPPLVNS